MQVIAQATQVEANTYQPPLPLTIVGQGFGFLSNLPQLQYYTQPTSTQYIEIQEWTAAPPNGQKVWDTANSTGNCQVYIADWTDTAISLLVGLPYGVQNLNNAPLNPLTDMSPQTFFQLTSGTVACPITQGYYLNVRITNPQSGTPTSGYAAQVISSTTGTTPY